jgi:alkylation response protein AidB-like acyl-CoA dehydrogenase
MDFSFSTEQDLLRAQARSFLEKRGDGTSFRDLAGLGWTGASIAEAHGGAGLGFLEEGIAFEELGRALYPGPFFATVGLALPALAGQPDLLRRVASGELSATLAWREPGSPVSLGSLDGMRTEATCVQDRWRLRGEKHLVPDAGAVGAFVVIARTTDGPALFFVERNGDRPLVAVPETVDATRPLGRLTLDGDEGRLLAAPPAAAEIVARTRSRALAALALEAAGVASHALEIAVGHAKTREQFGKPIGVYQAVSHQLANVYVQTELARSLAYWAAWCIAEGSGDSPGGTRDSPGGTRDTPGGARTAGLAAVAAKAYAAEAAVEACERAIQVHGGMGFTWDHPLHRYYKRAQWIESFEGSGAAHRAEIARALLDQEAQEGSQWTV